MGLDPNQLAQTPGTSPPIEPSFILTCPGCNYDLRGLADGVCPECGRHFVVADLEAVGRRTWAARVAYQSVSPDWLLLVLAFPTLLGWPAALSASPRSTEVLLLWTALLWLGTVYWSWRGRWVIFRPSCLRLSWFIVPILWTTVLLVSALARPAPYVIVAPVLGVTCILLAWARTTPRQMWIPPAILAATLLSPAALFAISGGLRLLRGLTWSWVPDLREGQIYRQYPFRNDELFYGGLLGALPGVLLACVAIVCWYRGCESNTQRVHTGHTGVHTPSAPSI